MSALVFVALCLVTYRITRFIELDNMLEDTRDRLILWLEERRGSTTGWRSTLYRKIHDGFICSFCVSVWVAAGAVAYHGLVLTEWPGWWFPIWWLAVAGGAMAFYRFIDPPE